MKCRQCESELRGVPEKGICTCKPPKRLIDPDELLGLVDRAIGFAKEAGDKRFEAALLYVSLYLSGNPEPLKKLAGRE